MVKLVFFVPESHLESVKTAVFAVGAGQQGNYDCCAWQVKGIGQFRPLSGSSPFLGQTDQLHQLEEYRVEMLCPKDKVQVVAQALTEAHPYEEPAFEFLTLYVVPNSTSTNLSARC